MFLIFFIKPLGIAAAIKMSYTFLMYCNVCTFGEKSMILIIYDLKCICYIWISFYFGSTCIFESQYFTFTRRHTRYTVISNWKIPILYMFETHKLHASSINSANKLLSLSTTVLSISIIVCSKIPLDTTLPSRRIFNKNLLKLIRRKMKKT